VFDQGHLLIGHYRAVWNGKDSNGQPVPAGEYKYVITVTDYFTSFDIPIIDTDTQYTGYITVGNNATLTPSLTVTGSSFAYILLITLIKTHLQCLSHPHRLAL